MLDEDKVLAMSQSRVGQTQVSSVHLLSLTTAGAQCTCVYIQLCVHLHHYQIGLVEKVIVDLLIRLKTPLYSLFTCK